MAPNSAIATVSLSVLPVNNPQANDDSYEVPIASPMTVAKASGVLANDFEVNGNTLHAILVTPPAIGTLTLNDDGSFVFASPPDFHGSTTFTYKANNGANSSNTATVTLTRPLFVSVTGGTLTLQGSLGDDTIRLRPVAKGGIDVEMNTPLGVISQVAFPQQGIKKFTFIDVEPSAGDDRFDSATLTIPTRVVGGAGNDVIRTGSAPDIIFGDQIDGVGTGADWIDAGNGNNTIVAGNGNNVIRTGKDRDSVTAGNGHNDIETGAGNDTVTAGTGGTFIDAGAGDDVVTVAGGRTGCKAGPARMCSSAERGSISSTAAPATTCSLAASGPTNFLAGRATIFCSTGQSR